VISIPLTRQSHGSLKASLARWAPGIKSSHRVEALARSLAFSTHAALIAAIDSTTVQIVTVESDAFGAYLRERDFEIDENIVHRAVAAAAIDRVRELHPRLASHGFGVPRLGRESWAERFRRFAANQAEMGEESFAGSFLLSLVLLREIPKTRTIRPRTNSYWLKHVAEKVEANYPNGARLGPGYVPNGAFIAAAIYAGFACRYRQDRDGEEHPNCLFNMSYRVLAELDARWRLDGDIAEQRREQAWAKARRAGDVIQSVPRKLVTQRQEHP
jgi:hypothetical protein